MPYPSASVIHLELTQGNNTLVNHLHKYIKPTHTQISSQMKWLKVATNTHEIKFIVKYEINIYVHENIWFFPRVFVLLKMFCCMTKTAKY